MLHDFIKALHYLTQAPRQGMLGPMRFLPQLIVLCTLFLASLANAVPMDGTDEGNAPPRIDIGLLDRIGEVGNRVDAKASQLVVGALGFLGVPYRRGGNNPETGFDCSGFVRAIYKQTEGLLLPRRAAEQAAATEKIDKRDLKPGDLVFFNTMRRAFSHVGIYVENGKFIHSPRPGGEVRVDDMGASYWTRRFDGARRVPADAANAGATAEQ